MRRRHELLHGLQRAAQLGLRRGIRHLLTSLIDRRNRLGVGHGGSHAASSRPARAGRGPFSVALSWERAHPKPVLLFFAVEKG